MSAPVISVIVPVYNVEPYLDRCVMSILRQTYVDFELILVDDGSPDRCGEMCDAWASKDLRIRVIHQANRGLSGARNAGLDIARGEYIAFVDSDDGVTPDYLETLLRLFDGRPRCAVTACNHIVIRGGKESPGLKVPEGIIVYPRLEAFVEVLWHGAMDVSACAKLYRRSVFDGLRYPEGRVFEDTWLFGDILARTEEVAVSGKLCYRYFIRTRSIVTGAFSEKNLQYIEAAEKLAKDAKKAGLNDKAGGIRRINHARMSILRYMERCEEKYKPIRTELRSAILADAPEYINDPRTPRRDRIAIALLRSGFGPFYIGWRIYTGLRG